MFVDHLMSEIFEQACKTNEYNEVHAFLTSNWPVPVEIKNSAEETGETDRFRSHSVASHRKRKLCNIFNFIITIVKHIANAKVESEKIKKLILDIFLEIGTIIASAHGALEVLNIFIGRGGNLNARNISGKTGIPTAFL